jgi:hypothetical protein
VVVMDALPDAAEQTSAVLISQTSVGGSRATGSGTILGVCQPVENSADRRAASSVATTPMDAIRNYLWDAQQRVIETENAVASVSVLRSPAHGALQKEASLHYSSVSFASLAGF